MKSQAPDQRPPAPPNARVLSRDGVIRVKIIGQPRRRLGDLYHMLLTAKWRTVVGAIAAVWIAANMFFATLYWFDRGGVLNAAPGSWWDDFFFSVQTMATVGYGHMAPVSFFTRLVSSVEVFVGLLGIAMATGLMFAKFSVPTSRVIFSRVAVITLRDGVPALSFRMANERVNRIIEAHLNLVLVRNEVKREGENFRRFHDLKLVRGDSPIFALTWTAVHPLDAESPLYGKTPEQLAATGCELLVTRTGIDEAFSQTIHARHSWIASELVWGARFLDVLRGEEDGRRIVDLNRFHATEPLAEAHLRSLEAELVKSTPGRSSFLVEPGPG